MSLPTRSERIVASALWSAYGDALGFISELSDRVSLRRRAGISEVKETMSWKRRVGGQMGAIAQLPPGTYSDDTQLRLATSRAIRGDGVFDVELFAKIELPVWTAYALGAGRGTKAAAVNLSKEGVNWFSNFYQSEGGGYLANGGNGAVMRIQPHVWCAPVQDHSLKFLLPVLKNSVSTHGNPRAFVSAALHALCLRYALDQAACPKITDVVEMLNSLKGLPHLMNEDEELRSVWIPAWEERSKRRLVEAILETLEELTTDLDKISRLNGAPDEKYTQAALDIGAMEESMKGAGTKTCLLALLLAHDFREMNPVEALQTAANLLGSDTDSIGTMCGALIGAAQGGTPPGEILDRHYIEKEALRLAKIGDGYPQEQFSYPDLFSWKPPRSQSEAVSLENGKMVIAGLGPADSEGEVFSSPKDASSCWQFLTLPFGQTFLIKRRKHLRSEAVASVHKREETVSPIRNKTNVQLSWDELETQQPDTRSIDELTSEAITGDFDPALVGKHLLTLSTGPNGIEKAVAYAAIIAKARLSRKKRQK